MSLIDAVDVDTSDEANVVVQLRAVPLAQFRETSVPGLTESFSAVWLKDGRQQSQLTDQFSFTGTANELQGNWEVQLTYSTSEVRSDPNGLLSDTKSFRINGGSNPSPTPPSPTPPSPTPPSPTPPSPTPTPPSPTPPTGNCVHEKDCDVNPWCANTGYE